MTDAEPSYIDYETFLDPSFSPTSFANTLVLATNNPSDTPLDLSTPLSRVLFDVQEIDTHIHTLTTKSALPLLTHTKENDATSQRIITEVEAQVSSLADGYQRLEKEVIQRWEAAEEVRLATVRLWQTVKIVRAVGRCLLLGRQLEVQMAEVMGSGSTGAGRKEDHRAMTRAANTLLILRQLFSSSGSGEEGEFLDHINAVKTLKDDLIVPSERHIQSRAQQIVREFSMSSLSSNAQQNHSTPSAKTYAQTETTKSLATSALNTLYLLSPAMSSSNVSTFTPTLLLTSLQTYIQTALTSSLASLTRALGTLPTLDRTLVEISARCQNIVALEALLASLPPPEHPLLFSPSTTSTTPQDTDDLSTISPTLLSPLLQSLDTPSLPSYFWRTLASALSPRVSDIMSKGGVSARTLRSNRERVRDAIRECVLRGSQLPTGSLRVVKGVATGNWEREAAVMVGAVAGAMGK
ncbi:MAG: hypothetical protein M1835_000410 [Candelina submexicana]|nr:MAG: hypothetical protein M1835_000410 [Candelina submexicana]